MILKKRLSSPGLQSMLVRPLTLDQIIQATSHESEAVIVLSGPSITVGSRPLRLKSQDLSVCLSCNTSLITPHHRSHHTISPRTNADHISHHTTSDLSQTHSTVLIKPHHITNSHDSLTNTHVPPTHIARTYRASFTAGESPS
jgi:hypothetical protein